MPLIVALFAAVIGLCAAGYIFGPAVLVVAMVGVVVLAIVAGLVGRWLVPPPDYSALPGHDASDAAGDPDALAADDPLGELAAIVRGEDPPTAPGSRPGRRRSR